MTMTLRDPRRTHDELPPPHELGARDREILKDIILTYILSAEPVSSRTVARRGQHGLSAASIRNVMADLEEWGYLTQPHTSAGRVPTREGYHLFIDTMMESRQVSARDRKVIDEALVSTPNETRQLLAACLYLLKDLSHQVSVVLTPAMADTVLKSVEFVRVSDTQVLCVVVSTNGFVDNKLLQIPAAVTRDELVWISNYVSETFAGLTVKETRERLLKLMAEDRAQVDRLLALSIDLAQRSLALEAEQRVLYDGADEILAQPELSDIGRVRQLFDTFSRRARLVTLLNQVITGNGVRVLIGADSDLTSELDFSLVATSYGVGGERLGTIGVFGPSRMEYPRVIPLVHYLGESLNRILAGTFADHKQGESERW